MFADVWDDDGLSGIKGLQKKAAAGDADAARKLEKKAAKKAAAASGGGNVSGGTVSAPATGTVNLPSPVVSGGVSGSSGGGIGDLFGSIPPIILYGGLAVVAFLMFRKSK